MLVIRTRHRDTKEQQSHVLDDEQYTLFSLSRLLDEAIASSQEISLALDSGDVFPLNPRRYDVIALVQPAPSSPG